MLKFMKIGILYNISHRTRTGVNADLCADGEIAATVRAVKAVFEKDNEVVLIQISEDAISYIKNAGIDVIFNICEGYGDDNRGEIFVAALLELTGVPFTGSDFLSLALCMDKERTREILTFHTIPGPRFQVFRKRDEAVQQDTVFPLIVKPAREDASIGIGPESIVKDEEELRRRVAYILESFAEPALAEEYIDGRELNVSIIGNGDSLTVLPISEIEFNIPPDRPKIVDYEAKWVKTSPMYYGTEAVCPALLTERDRRAVEETAMAAYRAAGVKDYGRVDIRLKEGTPYVIEVNPNPGKYVDTGFIRSAKAAGYSFEDICRKIIDLTLTRYGKKPLSAARTEQSSPPAREAAGPAMKTAALFAIPVAAAHIPILTRWFNDGRVSRFMDSPDEILSDDEVFEIMLISRTHDGDFVFCENETRLPVAFGAIYDFTPIAKSCEISFLIGEPAALGKGFGKQIARAMTEYCFYELKVESIFCSVVTENEACIKSLLASGYKKIGIRRRSHTLKDVFYDEYFFDITRIDWEKWKNENLA